MIHKKILCCIYILNMITFYYYCLLTSYARSYVIRDSIVEILESNKIRYDVTRGQTFVHYILLINIKVILMLLTIYWSHVLANHNQLSNPEHGQDNLFLMKLRKEYSIQFLVSYY